MRTIKRDIVGAFIFSADNKLLLGKSIKGGVYANVWIIPGGGIEADETHLQALCRKVLEETGIDITDAIIEAIEGTLTSQSEKVLRETGEKVMVDMVFFDYKVSLTQSADAIQLATEDDFTEACWFDVDILDTLPMSPPSITTLQKLGYLKYAKQTISFAYPSFNDPLFAELRNLADISLDDTTVELDKIRAVTGYAHGLFTHDGDNEPSSFDPTTIIKEAKAGLSFRCAEYSLLSAALLWAYGIPSRMIGLKTKDVETREYGAGHLVTEFWSADHGKWIMCDVQAGIMPTYEGTLLSTFELREVLEQGKLLECEPLPGSRFGTGTFTDAAAYTAWIQEYLYFIDTAAETTFKPIDRREAQIVMLVPHGLEPPIMFQGMFKMNALYTDNVSEFYAAPAV